MRRRRRRASCRRRRLSSAILRSSRSWCSTCCRAWCPALRCRIWIWRRPAGTVSWGWLGGCFWCWLSWVDLKVSCRKWFQALVFVKNKIAFVCTIQIIQILRKYLYFLGWRLCITHKYFKAKIFCFLSFD